MASTIVFIHGMFQNARSWDGWARFFEQRGYECVVESWPLHEGEPAALRANPPAGLGDLRLQMVIDRYAELIRVRNDRPIAIGHSAGGLVVQKLAEQGLIAAGVPIASAAPNRMLAFDWGFLRNSVAIANPIAGNAIFEMTAERFHRNVANTMAKAESDAAYERTATHDSRNVQRDCMLGPGDVDLGAPHVPLLFLAAEKDEICPQALCVKNAHAYTDAGSVSDYREFPNRGHFICGQPGWEEVASFVADWLGQHAPAVDRQLMGAKI